MVVEHARLRMTAMFRFLQSWTPGRPGTAAGVHLSVVVLLGVPHGMRQRTETAADRHAGARQVPATSAASASLNDRKWLTSREYFRQLVDVYPQSPYRADAKLGIGDTYHRRGNARIVLLGNQRVSRVPRRTTPRTVARTTHSTSSA